MKPYYEDAAVTLYHGDCRDILPTLEAVDHVITDPPYARDVYVRMNRQNALAVADVRAGIGKTGQIGRMAAGAIGDIDELIWPLAPLIAAIVKRWVIVFSDAESTHEWREALVSAGLRYVRTGAWVKPDPMPQMTGDRPATGFEPCTIAHAPGPMRWNGGGSPAAWTYTTHKGATRPNHPCPKPEPLMDRLVEQFTDSGDVILDMFGGSGTLGVSAKRLGRRAILIEKEERYCEVAATRLLQGALELGFSTSPRSDPHVGDSGKLTTRDLLSDV